MAQYDWTYFTHGVNVQVEYPERLTKFRRAGFGTIVEQSANTQNWFHFAVPTPNQLNEVETVKHEGGFLKATLNQNTHITRVDIWAGNRKIIGQAVDLRGPDVYHTIVIPHDQARDAQGRWAGIVICVLVEFLTGTPIGQVIFEGAGMTFERS